MAPTGSRLARTLGVGQVNHGENLGTAVIGAGPAGLTSAWVLARAGRTATVLEADGIVGGISKTVEFEGYRFDLGGHRFYTKLDPVLRLWKEMLGDELLTRPRMSRIYYHGRFFSYPLRAQDVFRGLGVVESVRCAFSYFYWRRRLKAVTPQTFQDWVVGRFGRRLYDAFFRSYTEKVWGIPGTEIQAEWAAQRIQEFSFWHAILGVLGLQRGEPKTLIEEFLYPRLGPGQMWEAVTAKVEERGIPVRLNRRCVAIKHDAGRVGSVVVESDGAGGRARCRRRALQHAAGRADRVPGAGGARSRASCGRRSALPKPLPSCLDDPRARALPG